MLAKSSACVESALAHRATCGIEGSECTGASSGLTDSAWKAVSTNGQMTSCITSARERERERERERKKERKKKNRDAASGAVTAMIISERERKKRREGQRMFRRETSTSDQLIRFTPDRLLLFAF